MCLDRGEEGQKLFERGLKVSKITGRIRTAFGVLPKLHGLVLNDKDLLQFLCKNKQLESFYWLKTWWNVLFLYPAPPLFARLHRYRFRSAPKHPIDLPVKAKFANKIWVCLLQRAAILRVSWNFLRLVAEWISRCMSLLRYVIVKAQFLWEINELSWDLSNHHSSPSSNPLDSTPLQHNKG